MVEAHNTEEWQCPYCSEKYHNYNDADECAQECVSKDIDEPIKNTCLPTWECEYCNKVYSRKVFAEHCEQEHIKNDDKYYQEYERNESLRKLSIAAVHPQQQSIESYY